MQKLSIFLIAIKEYKKASILLRRVYQIDSTDAKTLFYYGIVLEAENNHKQAFRIFKKFPDVSALSPYRAKMKAKFELFERERIGEEARKLIAEDANLGVQTVMPDAIAVFPLQYLGSDEEYAPLGRGVSEMIITDLSQIKKLTLIERIRLQAMTDEINLQQTGIGDEATFPKYGKKIGAGRILWGEYDVTERKRFSINASLVNAYNAKSVPVKASQVELLNRIFDLEKRLVFGVLKGMNIELTPEEKERILHVPTKNLQAFMAYCTGLEKQDKGQYQNASEYFQKAGNLDPGFREAGNKFEECIDSFEMQRGAEFIAMNSENIETGLPSAPVQNVDAMTEMVNDRIQNISGSIGSTFMQGQEERKPTTEAVTSGADVGAGVLPNPPGAPGR